MILNIFEEDSRQLCNKESCHHAISAIGPILRGGKSFTVSDFKIIFENLSEDLCTRHYLNGVCAFAEKDFLAFKGYAISAFSELESTQYRSLRDLADSRGVSFENFVAIIVTMPTKSIKKKALLLALMYDVRRDEVAHILSSNHCRFFY